MSVWVLARELARLPDGEVVYSYFTQTGRSLFRADAYKFHDAKAARECADTHRALRDSDDWRVLEVIDGNRMRPWKDSR